ncbi:hypothetical protein ACLOJK_041232 [Asimina triloba]
MELGAGHVLDCCRSSALKALELLESEMLVVGDLLRWMADLLAVTAGSWVDGSDCLDEDGEDAVAGLYGEGLLLERDDGKMGLGSCASSIADEGGGPLV